MTLRSTEENQKTSTVFFLYSPLRQFYSSSGAIIPLEGEGHIKTNNYKICKKSSPLSLLQQNERQKHLTEIGCQAKVNLWRLSGQTA